MGVDVKFGGQPMEVLIGGLDRETQVREPDILYALNRQKTRILERTARGVDINGQAFVPYSSKGPYYYYPGKASKGRGAAAGRTAKKLGGQRTRLGVKFASYGDFKRSLGRGAVDLLGPSAPHMLQAIVVKTEGRNSGVIGIYGPEADRAEGHNTGGGHLPKREFFGASDSDLDMIGADIKALMEVRLNGFTQ